jgi:hypothetical protein
LIDARIFLDSAPSMGEVLFAVRLDAIATAYRVQDTKSCSQIKQCTVVQCGTIAGV